MNKDTNSPRLKTAWRISFPSSQTLYFNITQGDNSLVPHSRLAPQKSNQFYHRRGEEETLAWPLHNSARCWYQLSTAELFGKFSLSRKKYIHKQIVLRGGETHNSGNWLAVRCNQESLDCTSSLDSKRGFWFFYHFLWLSCWFYLTSQYGDKKTHIFLSWIVGIINEKFFVLFLLLVVKATHLDGELEIVMD